MSTDFSTKAAFLRHLESILPDDAHYYRFTLQYNSCAGLRPVCMPGVLYKEGLLIKSISCESISNDGRLSTYTIEGQL